VLSVDAGGYDEAPPAERLPAEYRHTTGSITRARTLPRIREFVERGGTLLAIGGATDIGRLLGLPVTDARVDGTGRPLARDQHYIPGSILRVRVDPTTPLGYGFAPEADVYFDNSPAFRIGPSASGAARRVAWFDGPEPLRSGWAWGQQYLDGALAVVEAPLGRGRVILYGPEILFRAQAHGTFKFLFNGIFYGPAMAGPAPASTP